MVAVYVTSLEKAAGKTAVEAGLGKHLLDSGKKVGFFKPLIIVAEGLSPEVADSDALFMKSVLSLDEPLEALCPVIIDDDKLASNLKNAYAKVAKDKDVVIIDGAVKASPASLRLVETLDARVIVVGGYSEPWLASRLASSGESWGKYLLGVVMNKVPQKKLELVSAELAGSGINVLGVLPEDRALSTITVGELAEYIHGEILNSADMSGELVENIMLGAMTVDPGPDYYGRKANKAVIVRGERPDMQLAALETPTRCLVISGDTPPIPSVAYNADSKKVPVIMTKDNTLAIVARIENALGKAIFNHDSKLARLTEIMSQHFNFGAVDKGLGISG